MIRETIKTAVNTGLTIAQKHSIHAGISQGLQATIEEIETFKAAVPVVGGFNAGKSSMINCFLNRDELLPIAIVPETAIAAEIRYAADEFVQAYGVDGAKTRYELSDIKNIPANTTKYLEVFVKNDEIKKLNDIILVDMPGLDSSIDAHNKAILNYISQGVYYIVAVDAEMGMEKSVLDFIIFYKYL